MLFYIRINHVSNVRGRSRYIVSRAEIASQNWLICHLGGKRRPTTNNFLFLLLISGVIFHSQYKRKEVNTILRSHNYSKQTKPLQK